MPMPGFTAEAAIYATETHYFGGVHGATPVGGANTVVPQLSLCSPCVQVGGTTLCVTLPFFGRRCLHVPFIGRWRICCRTRWGWPPISCSVGGC